MHDIFLAEAVILRLFWFFLYIIREDVHLFWCLSLGSIIQNEVKVADDGVVSKYVIMLVGLNPICWNEYFVTHVWLQSADS